MPTQCSKLASNHGRQPGHGGPIFERNQMLVLSRREGEKIVIEVGGERIEVMVVERRGPVTRIGIEASRDVVIFREEIEDREGV